MTVEFNGGNVKLFEIGQRTGWQLTLLGSHGHWHDTVEVVGPEDKCVPNRYPWWQLMFMDSRYERREAFVDTIPFPWSKWGSKGHEIGRHFMFAI